LSRFHPAKIPAGVPKVFCTNAENGDIFPVSDNPIDNNAINRRHKKMAEPEGGFIPHALNDRQLQEKAAELEVKNEENRSLHQKRKTTCGVSCVQGRLRAMPFGASDAKHATANWCWEATNVTTDMCDT
jgi:hypothetical protein